MTSCPDVMAADNYSGSVTPGAGKEFMTIDELAAWLAVSKNTVRNWMDDGVLKAGAEFIEVGRVLRFLPTITLNKLLEHSAKAANSDTAVETLRPQQRKVPSSRTAKRHGINLDY